jgi:hypothetical protein
MGLAIPPKADRFIVDSYCPASATKVYLSRIFDLLYLLFITALPTRRHHCCIGISTYSFTRYDKNNLYSYNSFIAHPFTGRSVWTKIIRNQTAVDYLFNGDAYDFNYQFANRLPQPIKLYPV